MSNENHAMQLRPRKSVLGDISNRASLPGGVDPVGGKGVVKTNKRMVRESLNAYPPRFNVRPHFEIYFSSSSLLPPFPLL